MQSDQPCHPGESQLIDEAIKAPDLRIYHLGFLRDKAAFYRKARALGDIWFNRYDDRLEKGEREGKPLWETECAYTDRLVRYDGYYPEGVRLWLGARGHVP